MLCTIEGRVKPLIASRSPVAGILAAAPTADFDRVWGRGYVTGDIFVRMMAGSALAAQGWTRFATFSSAFLRLALGISFLSAVADRFGLWGVYGQPNVSWGS